MDRQQPAEEQDVGRIPNNESLDQLHDHLNALPTGPVTNPREVESLLMKCWDALDGDDGGMQPEKLVGRTEEMSWTPPHLTFVIERHGGRVMGSKRAELQAWTVDTARGVREIGKVRYRQLDPPQPRLDVEPLAEDVFRLIREGTEDSRLKWYDDGRVRVNIGKIFPDDAVQRTLAGRRKRFWACLDKLLPNDWTRKGNIYTPQG